MMLPLDSNLLQSIESSLMYPFQKEGSLFCASNDRCLLGDEMGLGKSAQALMSVPKNSPIMIICRAGIKYNWVSEINKWRPDLKSFVISGRDRFFWPSEGEAVIINHDILPKSFVAPSRNKSENIFSYKERLNVFRRNLVSHNRQALLTNLIVDEAHDFKNYSSLRSKKLKEICKLAKKVIGLTGSPLINKPLDLYCVFDVLGIAAETFGSFHNFKRLFNAKDEIVNRKGQTKIIWGNPNSSVPELLKKRMLRRLRKDVLPELPNKSYSRIIVDLSGKLLRKQMDCLFDTWNHIFSANELPPFSCFTKVRENLANSRIGNMIAFVEESEEQNIPLVVFSSYLAPLEALSARNGWAIISGNTTPKLRQKIVDSFQNNELKGVGLSIRAGGVGINLTNACRALFVDLDWSPAVNWQAEDRIARIGQNSKKVDIVHMVSNHPLDVHLHGVIDSKIKTIQQSLGAT